MKILLVLVALAGIAAIFWPGRKPVELVRIDGPVGAWKIPGSWSIGRGDQEGKPVFTRFNLSLRSVIGHPSFAKQLGITVPFASPTENGLPESDEFKRLDQVEAEIVRLFVVNNESLFAGVITTGNMREFVLYTSNEAAARAKAQQLAGALVDRKIQFVVNDDPEWNVYKQFAGL